MRSLAQEADPSAPEGLCAAVTITRGRRADMVGLPAPATAHFRYSPSR